jgi:hypothetical protein
VCTQALPAPTATGSVEAARSRLGGVHENRSPSERFDNDEREVVARYLRGATEAFESVAGPAPVRVTPAPLE